MKVGERIKRISQSFSSKPVQSALPRGVSLHRDVARFLPSLRLDIIFDVGANVGQSAMAYLTQFPKAQVYCFEPVDETFRLLLENIGKCENVRPFRLAFAAARGEDKMVLDGPSDQFYLISATNCRLVCDVRLEQVEVETIDEFCVNHGVSRISYLKVDTEGSDLKVLHGAKRMLAAHSIDIIEVEAGMNRGNKLHVPFVDFIDFFDRNDYFLFAIYEQMHEWPTKEPHLRRTNPVFVSNSVIQSNRG